MHISKQELDISALLQGNASLSQDWMQPPQVAHIPFGGSRETFFLLINVHVKPEVNSREKLATRCFIAAQLIISSGLLINERGVEISAFVDNPRRENLRRVFRLSILDTAFVPAMQIASTDLLNQQHIGITCQWPLQPPPPRQL